MPSESITDVVKEKYGQAALRVVAGGSSSCCGGAPGRCALRGPDHGYLYGSELGELPDTAVLASLGCGNPTALAQLNPGEVVLGPGGREAASTCLLSARRVGPTGKAYGLDMTDENAGPGSLQ